ERCRARRRRVRNRSGRAGVFRGIRGVAAGRSGRAARGRAAESEGPARRPAERLRAGTTGVDPRPDAPASRRRSLRRPRVVSGKPTAKGSAVRSRRSRPRQDGAAGAVADASPAPYARGFPPVSDADARVLVLGSLPGETSIEMRQYYAQPRNAFWPIMGELCGAAPSLPYPRRLERLRAAGIALCDVLAAGERRGSLDSAIVPSSMVVNDFAAFFAAHPQIRFVSFNGSKAAELFVRRVLPALPAEYGSLEMTRLPSTSPANASYSFER